MEKKLTKGMLMTALICGTISIVPFGAVAHAEEAAADDAALQGFTLDQIVVTAVRTENKLVDTPANVSIIDSEIIEKRNYQTVVEALNDVPGVIMKKSGFGGDDNHIYLNGDDRVLVMVDGRRLNKDTGTSGRSGFDMTNLPSPEFIERIEILKGAGSSLYGSDAAGGVVNIITKSAKKNYVKLNINAGSWGTENYNLAASVKAGKTGIYVTAGKSRQDYVKFKEATTKQHRKWPNSANEMTSATIKIDQEIGTDQLATFYFDHSFKEGRKPYYAPDLGGWNTLYPNDYGTDLNNNVALKYQWGINSDNKGYVQIYRNYYAGTSMNQGIYSKYSERKDGFDAQQTIKLGKNNTLTGGVEWRNSKINQPATYRGLVPKIINKAIFLQDSWQFAPTWLLNAGVRYDKHNYFGHKTTFSAAINKKFNENSHAYFSWGQIFNAPQGNDLFYYSNGGGWGDSYGNPNLKPEKGQVFTIGYDTKINEKTQIGINAFYSKINDAIAWQAVTPGLWNSDWTVNNIDKQKRRGFEFNFKHEINDNLSVNGSYAYVKVENSNNGAAYTRDLNVLPNQYKIGLSYQDKKFGAELYGRGGTGASQTQYVDSSYLTLDLSLQYKIKPNWKIYAKGYNLTNASYAERGGRSGIRNNFPAYGRCFLFGTEYTF